MGVTIRIELQDDEGIFGPGTVTQEDLVSFLQSAMVEVASTGISGPFTTGGTHAYIVKIPDKRPSWKSPKLTEHRPDASTHD